MLKLGWLSTGRGEGSIGFLKYVQEMIVACELDASIEFVFSNRERGEDLGSDHFFSLVDSYNIPLLTLSSKKWCKERDGGPFRDHRVEFHEEVLSLIQGFGVDLNLFLGYMLFTHPRFVEICPSINLHPAAPGGAAGTWQSVIWELIENKTKYSGVRAHVVTQNWDAGPVISYCTYPIVGDQFDQHWSDANRMSINELKRSGEKQVLFRLIREAGLIRERPVIVATLRLLASGEVVVRDGQALGINGKPIKANDVTREVERLVSMGDL